MKHATLLLFIVALTGCSGKRQAATPAPETLRNIPVLAVQSTRVPDLLEAAGTVRACQSSALASQMMGNIVGIRVQEGDQVKRGQVLATLDDAQPRAALDRADAAGRAAEQELAAANADLNLAQSTLQRYQKLYEKKSVSPQEFDEVQARRQAAFARREMAQAGESQAKAALAQARSAFDYTQIRAPFDGVITDKKADLGNFASPGMPIFTLEDNRCYRLEATVNESDLRFVLLHQPIAVTIDAYDTELRGRVTQIVPAADATSRTFLVKVDLPSDSRLRSGLFGRARFSRGEHLSLLIPRTAVIDRGQLQGVFILDQNEMASLRYITLGNTIGEGVEVLAGLQSGEKLVTQPGKLDLNGKRIEARPQ